MNWDDFVPWARRIADWARDYHLNLRDRPVLRPDCEVVARNAAGDPLIFAPRPNAIGFLGHPGMKRGMAEDLIMEFADTPDDCPEALAALGREQADLAEALGPLMVWLVARCGWM